MDYTTEAINRITAKRKTMQFNSVLEWANRLNSDRYPTQSELAEIVEKPNEGRYCLRINGLDYCAELFDILRNTESMGKVLNIGRPAPYSVSVLMEY